MTVFSHGITVYHTLVALPQSPDRAENLVVSGAHLRQALFALLTEDQKRRWEEDQSMIRHWDVVPELFPSAKHQEVIKLLHRNPELHAPKENEATPLDEHIMFYRSLRLTSEQERCIPFFYLAAVASAAQRVLGEFRDVQFLATSLMRQRLAESGATHYCLKDLFRATVAIAHAFQRPAASAFCAKFYRQLCLAFVTSHFLAIDTSQALFSSHFEQAFPTARYVGFAHGANDDTSLLVHYVLQYSDGEKLLERDEFYHPNEPALWDAMGLRGVLEVVRERDALMRQVSKAIYGKRKREEMVQAVEKEVLRPLKRWRVDEEGNNGLAPL